MFARSMFVVPPRVQRIGTFVAALALAGGVAQAQFSYRSNNPSPIAIPVGGPASIYPSTISVPADTNQGITRIVVTLHGLTHTFPGDVDAILVGPNGRTSAVIMDAGTFQDVSNLTVVIDSASTSLPPASGPLGPGPYRPANLEDFDGTDTFPPPAPAGPFNGDFSVFFGEQIAGDWSLYVQDDNAIFDSGSFSHWSIAFFTEPRRNHLTGVPLALSATLGPNSTYPITVPVHGLQDQSVQSVAVELAFNHRFVRDLDVLLVAPNGAACVLMSDINNGFVSLSDSVVLRFRAGAPPLPSFAVLTSGDYSPWDTDPDEVYPLPAPPGPHGTNMAVFNGGPAHGNWRLFIVDDQNDTQYIPPDTLSRFVVEINGVPFCPGDFNKDRSVDLLDLLAFISDWSANLGANCP